MAELKQEEARSPEKTRAMAFELRQIIQADRMAMRLIEDAQETRRSIEKKTKEETAKILQEAEQQRQEMTQEAYKNQQKALEEKKQEAREAYAAQMQDLKDRMEQNRENWVAEITAALLNG